MNAQLPPLVAPQAITLTIQLDNSGRISISGPVQDTLLCYGMLERARDIIKDLADGSKKLDKPQILVPTLAGV